MVRWIAVATLAVLASNLGAQSARPKFEAFEVATIKPTEPGPKSGRFIAMQDKHHFVEKSYTLQLLIAAAWNLNPRTVSGGPSWVSSDHYDIAALTPGDVQPTHDEQMTMLRTLVANRFQLRFHRKQKVFAIYALTVARDGPKLKNSTSAAGDPVVVGPGMVYPQRVVLPARNATMSDFVSLLQRAILDRPVVDQTSLTGRYDFDLDWAPDETQFDGSLASPSAGTPSPPLFTAIQEQLGLKLTATRGPVETLVVDKAEQPTPN
ncbi:MAG TPA: TIGR03435 family protein [Acidobacteriaceae bacterium]|jgi:uncharacterized protein (TIGR03435 family)|nr:TIGR03435 family protein [Acidobacteriaceae bacterium]